jgi:uncharacterized SAM-binding protein YcdF (DUF218 family)
VLGRVLAAVLMVVGLWLVAAAVLFVWPPGASAPPAHADAVVVLSGGLNRRLDPALAIVRRGVAHVLVISGAFHQNWPRAVRLCDRGGAGFRVICFNPSPFSTRGEAREIARLAALYRWRRVVVVTSTFHVTRARMLIRRCYHGRLWMVGASSPNWRKPEEWALETGKLLVQITTERGC